MIGVVMFAALVTDDDSLMLPHSLCCVLQAECDKKELAVEEFVNREALMSLHDEILLNLKAKCMEHFFEIHWEELGWVHELVSREDLNALRNRIVIKEKTAYAKEIMAGTLLYDGYSVCHACHDSRIRNCKSTRLQQFCANNNRHVCATTVKNMVLFAASATLSPLPCKQQQPSMP